MQVTPARGLQVVLELPALSQQLAAPGTRGRPTADVGAPAQHSTSLPTGALSNPLWQPSDEEGGQTEGVTMRCGSGI